MPIVLAFLLMLSSFSSALTLFEVQDRMHIMHSNDYYAVSFDGEGDAIVRAKFVIMSTAKQPIEELTLQMPENTIVYHVAQLDHGEYKTLDFTTERFADYLDLKIKLLNPINQDSYETVVIMYKIPLLAKKDIFGNFNFDFRTAIDRNAVITNKVRVAINVQPGFILKGVRSEVDYKQDFFSESLLSQVAYNAKEQRYVPKFYNEYYNIEYARGLVKEAYSLDRFESFTVSGSYSENAFALFLPEIATGLAVIAVIVAITVLVRRRLAKRAAAQGKLRPKEEASASALAFAEEIKKSAFLTVFFISVLTAIAVLATGFVAGIILDALGRTYLSYGFSTLLGITFLLIVIAAIIFEFVFSAYIVYKRHTIMHAIATFFLTLVFIFVFLFAIALFWFRPTIIY